MTYFETWVEQ